VEAVREVLRKVIDGDRAGLEAALRSDGTFRDDEIDIALELIDESIGGDPDYRIVVSLGEGATVQGYICFGLTPMTRATYDLYWIVVGADARGKGVARALVDAMETEIRAEAKANGEPVASIRVETSPADGHGAARAMYEKLGYPIASELADFYSPGEGLITYYKQLRAS
jgi:ribosomal protein S18 acetylase RimI-like enzyme